MVVEAVFAKSHVEVAKVLKRLVEDAMVVESVVPVALRKVTPPALVTENSVVVAVPVEEAMLKRVVLVSPTFASIESLA